MGHNQSVLRDQCRPHKKHTEVVEAPAPNVTPSLEVSETVEPETPRLPLRAPVMPWRPVTESEAGVNVVIVWWSARHHARCKQHSSHDLEAPLPLDKLELLEYCGVVLIAPYRW